MDSEDTAAAERIAKSADVVIFVSYMLIPLQLVGMWFSVSMARVDQHVVVCFFSFILTCGFTHLFNVLSLPEGYVAAAKVLCAVASAISVIVLQLSWHQVTLLLTRGHELQRSMNYLSNATAEMFERNVELIRENAEILIYAEKVERDNEEMDRLSKAKSSFMAMISHEIRTPLNAIMGSVDLMTSSSVSRFSDEDKEYLAVIRDSGRLLLNLLNDVIDAGSIDVGNFRLDSDVFNLMDLVHTTIKIIEARATSRRLRLDVVVDHSVPGLIKTDRRRLQQVLLNTLTNAIKFTPAEGLITVRVCVWSQGDLDMWKLRDDVVTARTSDLPPTDVDSPPVPENQTGSGSAETSKDREYLVLEVDDTGIGIPEEKQHDVFERFERVGEKGSEIVSGGSGLGLYITYKIVTAMGGVIFLRSEKGVGSRFSIVFPMDNVHCDSDAQEESDTSTSSAASMRVASNTSNLSSSTSSDNILIEDALLTTFVLVAEDNKLNRMVMERMFIRLHCASNVHFVQDGKEAVEVMGTVDDPFPLVFMDMHMPIMEGDVATQQIRLTRGRKAFIVLVSAEHVPGWREMGFDAAILKPFTLKILRKAIYDYIRERTNREREGPGDDAVGIVVHHTQPTDEYSITVRPPPGSVAPVREE